MNVLVNQLHGFRSKSMPEQPAISAGWFHGFIYLRQPAIILFVGTEHWVWRKGLPNLAQKRVFAGKLIAHLVIGEALLRRHQPFVSAYSPIHAGKERKALLHLNRKLFAQFVNIGDDLLDGL